VQCVFHVLAVAFLYYLTPRLGERVLFHDLVFPELFPMAVLSQITEAGALVANSPSLPSFFEGECPLKTAPPFRQIRLFLSSANGMLTPMFDLLFTFLG